MSSIFERSRFELLDDSYRYYFLENAPIGFFQEHILPKLHPEVFLLLGEDQATIIVREGNDNSELTGIFETNQVGIAFQCPAAIFVASFPSDAIEVPGILVSVYEGLAKEKISLVCTFTLHTTAYYIVHENERDEFLDIFYAVIERVQERYGF